MNLYLNIFSFIVDIRPGSEYPLMNEVNIFIIIIIIIIIIINIYSVPFINTVSRSSSYKLKKINKRITTFKITHKIYMIIIRVPEILREVTGLVIKYYKHPINLGFRMCSTGLLLWKNQEGSTCYVMILYKRDSTADIFL